MTKLTKLSPKGEVIIPPDVQARYGWKPGAVLEFVDGPNGVTLQAQQEQATTKTLSFDEAMEKMRKTVDYKGPRYDDADWKPSIDQMFREA